jgi:hypothetical protein
MVAWAVPWALAGAGLAVWRLSRGGYQWQRLTAHAELMHWPTRAGGIRRVAAGAPRRKAPA